LDILDNAWSLRATYSGDIFPSTERNVFPETLKLRAPAGLLAALKLAATRRHSSYAEFVRQTLLSRLEQEGVLLRDGKVEEIDMMGAPWRE
jgi:hypothetical protein